MGFVTSQTAHVEQQVNEVVYPDIQYPQLIPVDTSAHPFAQTVEYYSSDKTGKAEWINGNADDVPLANGERTKHQTRREDESLIVIRRYFGGLAHPERAMCGLGATHSVCPGK